PAAVPYLFDIEDDGPGVGIGTGPEAEVLEREIGLVAHADDGREPDLLGQAPVDDGGDDRPALGDERDPPRFWRDRVEGGVDSPQREHQPEAVRPDDPDIVLSG